ncbi:MAG: sigma-70 family RNA polymerase sigma factor [Gemmatimonadales bacterium]
MTDPDWLARQFEADRPRLRTVAYRILGSGAEADDAVQEAWLRLSRAERDGIDNLGGWLTTVVARVAMGLVRSRKRREARTDVAEAEYTDDRTPRSPDEEIELADGLGMALQAVLDTLSPAERLAFVLHDVFDVPFDQIGEVLGRSTAATKQLASRARNKVKGRTPEPDDDPERQRAVVDAFLQASRAGDFATLLTLLAPEVELQADPAAIRMGSPARVLGAEGVAGMFSGRAQGAEAAVLDGAVGVVWFVRDALKVAWDFTIRDGRVVAINMLADSASLGALQVEGRARLS